MLGSSRRLGEFFETDNGHVDRGAGPFIMRHKLAPGSENQLRSNNQKKIADCSNSSSSKIR